jgi:hypothetical protein
VVVDVELLLELADVVELLVSDVDELSDSLVALE